MTTIIGVMVLAAFFGGAFWQLAIAKDLDKPLKKADKKRTYICILLLVGFLVRVIAAISYKGHDTDMNCFIGWSDKIFKDGLSQFYLSDGFHDYPPGYVYVMYILGAIKNIFSLENEGLWLLIKMPSIIADLVMGYFGYSLLSKQYKSSTSAMIAALFILNPVIILNSCNWGQVDSILGLLCVLAVYFASEKKLIHSFAMLAIGILVKPQALFVAPIIGFAVIEQEFLADGFKKERFIKTVLGGLCAVAGMFVLFMPFGNNPIEGIGVVLNQYISTIGQYNYMTVNAFNLFGALGKNWTEVTPFASAVGYTGIVLSVLGAGYVFFKSKHPSRYYISAFVVIFGIYMLSVKMHERYAFVGLFMLIAVLATAPTKKNAIMYGVFSLSQFFNIAWVLYAFATELSGYSKSPVIVAASMINVIIAVFIVRFIKDEFLEKSVKIRRNVTVEERDTAEVDEEFAKNEKPAKITAFDIGAIIVITVIYAAVAFYNLGNKYAPQTEAVISNEPIRVDLGDRKQISETAFFLGARHLTEERSLEFKYYDNDNKLVKEYKLESASVFCWTMNEENAYARYVEISTDYAGNPDDESDRIYLNELCLLDEYGNRIVPVNTNENDRVNALFDEQDYMPDGKSYMAGTYFDEIYHSRTAYEFIHRMSVYEWTHPPLGKVFISMGVKIFGMTPFGWRFAGTFFGVLMVAVIYLLSRRILKHKWLAVAACLLFTFDFMHFAQTRLSTIDTYVTFFIMLMYYYMYKYCSKSFYRTPLKKTFIPLGLSGIFFGLSVASKWTGLYAGAGLAVIFFKSLYDRYAEYRKAKRNISSKTKGEENRRIAELFAGNAVKTLLFCCVMFVAVPALIYGLSYIPYMNTVSGKGIATIFDNARDMLTYHGKTVVSSTHPYSSYWYEWPVMYRPIWYFSNTLDNGLKQGISAFGNPAVWWLGIPATAYTLALAIIIPLRNKNYYGRKKSFYAYCYMAIFVVFTIAAAVTGASDEKYARFLPCMLFYSVVFVGIFLAVLAYEKRLKNISTGTAAFLAIGYFANLLPWTLVLRTTYIYHYFPCVAFVVLMICNSIKTIYDNTKNKRRVIMITAGYVAVALILFAMFYPVLSGHPIGMNFAKTWLKWFESWVLV